MDIITFLSYYIVIVILGVVAAYVIVRVGAFAYYRTKFEHFLRIKRESGGDDGEEV